MKSWKFTVKVNYWCLFNRFQYLVEVSVTALRNLQSKICRDNKPTLSLLGWKLLARPNMTHQAWQIAYTLHSSVSEPVKIIQIYILNTGKIKLELRPEEYCGKWGRLHCPVKALKWTDFCIQKWYRSWRQDYLLFRANYLHREVAEKALVLCIKVRMRELMFNTGRFSVIPQHFDERADMNFVWEITFLLPSE